MSIMEINADGHRTNDSYVRAFENDTFASQRLREATGASALSSNRFDEISARNQSAATKTLEALGLDSFKLTNSDELQQPAKKHESICQDPRELDDLMARRAYEGFLASLVGFSAAGAAVGMLGGPLGAAEGAMLGFTAGFVVSPFTTVLGAAEGWVEVNGRRDSIANCNKAHKW